ncbi:MAG: transporter substrate-binding domain-containing protein [Bradyrhizobiaceae bacterium]|nr:MAG: transporter substrate-binding domain-containing protein [Bradyrhizobiaceae bacterium]
MKSATVLGLVMTMSISAGAMALEGDALKELAPTGKLRVGVAYAPSATPVFVAKDESGGAHGVPRDLGDALAKKLGVPVDLTIAATTNELTDGVAAGTLDIGFMPADDTRRERVNFSPAYFVIESTYLAGASTDIKTMADVDRKDITVVGINGSTTMRSAARSLKNATVVPAKSIDEALDMLKSGKVQALALTQDSLPKLQKQIPGSRILDGAFQKVGVAIAVHKDRPAALAFVTSFMDGAKSDGTVRKAFDASGLQQLAIAP